MAFLPSSSTETMSLRNRATLSIMNTAMLQYQRQPLDKSGTVSGQRQTLFLFTYFISHQVAHNLTFSFLMTTNRVTITGAVHTTVGELRFFAPFSAQRNGNPICFPTAPDGKQSAACCILFLGQNDGTEVPN